MKAGSESIVLQSIDGEAGHAGNCRSQSKVAPEYRPDLGTDGVAKLCHPCGVTNEVEFAAYQAKLFEWEESWRWCQSSVISVGTRHSVLAAVAAICCWC